MMRSIPIQQDLSLSALRSAYQAARPLRLPKGLFISQGTRHGIPACWKWFEPCGAQHSVDAITAPCTPKHIKQLNYNYLNQFANALVPVEWTKHRVAQGHDPTKIHPDLHEGHAVSVESFQKAELPLSTFLALVRSKMDASSIHIDSSGKASAQPSNSSVGAEDRFYLAQCPLQALPEPMRADLQPLPSFIREASDRGDIYESSIWVGMAPTYTPLHKDPNPNFFVQLASSKVIRAFPPDVGVALLREGSNRLNDAGATDVRTFDERFMQGKERQIFYELIWDDDAIAEADWTLEATLEEGDGVFIPKGWWHSFRGVGPGINGSVRNPFLLLRPG